MRRSDRQITDLDDIKAIVAKCDVCRLAFNQSDGFPYILPLNFGYCWDGDQLTLYFHSALEGAKHEIIASDNRASFEMDCDHDLLSIEERGYCTMNYASVIGRGTIEYVTDDAEKTTALVMLTDRYHTEHFAFNPASMPRTSVYKLTVTSYTAKRKVSKRQ